MFLLSHRGPCQGRTTYPNGESPPDVQTLITKFSSLFQSPSTLLSERETNHHIHLLPQATPVNVHPYRYPHYQKCEIELQVENML